MCAASGDAGPRPQPTWNRLGYTRQGRASRSFTLYVGLQITTPSLPAATVGQKYSVALSGTGGTQPYAWSAKGLPQDVRLDKDGTFVWGSRTGRTGAIPST